MTTMRTERPGLRGEVAAGVRARLSGLEGVDHLARGYWADTADDDLAPRELDDLVGAAVAHWRLAEVRQPGQTLVRVHCPDTEEDGWRSPHAVVEVVSDDMPFIVSSASLALGRLGHALHLSVHPVFAVQRDGTGRAVAVGPLATAMAPGAEAEGWHDESFLHLEIDRVTDPERVAELRDELVRVLGHVAAAVDDWDPMVERLREVAVALRADGPGRDRAEAAALADWMADGAFVLLGAGDYEPGSDDGALHLVEGSGLGILRGYEPGRSTRLLGAMSSAGRVAFSDSDDVLLLTKAMATSTIQRAAHLDLVGVKRFDADGQFVGEHRFLGLWTASAYTAPVTTVPVVRAKVAEIERRAGFPADGHSASALRSILERHPRDELFQATVDDLLDTTLGILHLQERKQVRLFVRHDAFGRYLSCLVFVPRDRYTTDTRLAIQEALATAVGATSVEYEASVTASALARLHLILYVDSASTTTVDVPEMTRRLTRIVRSWEDDLIDDLLATFGEEQGRALAERWSEAFPVGYQADFGTGVALGDLRRALAQGPGDPPATHLYRPLDGPPGLRRLKLFRTGGSLTLSTLLPILSGLGVEVVDERPYELHPIGGDTVRIYDIGLLVPAGVDLDDPARRERFCAAFTAVWSGDAEDDAFNRLVVQGGVDWRDVALLRALCKYLRQVGIRYSEAYMADSLVAHADLVGMLVELFHARFDLTRRATSVEDQTRAAFQLERGLEAVPSLDDDRILRALDALVQATVRTNFFQPDAQGRPKAHIVCKFDPSRVPDLPLPRPKHEIWVYSPRVEGVHLRAGNVARGGIRWSDRREDFRTEILGLVKAQTVKNAVIVPTGAKGGFVLKRPPIEGGREALQAEGVACYRTFIGGLLDVTDDIRAGAVVPPPDVIRYDDDDPYLVVAADKGTATFSDVANEIALARGYWLGDAFASGGSAGYDHKEMGITARGAWESVRAHFAELDVDLETAPISVVGIGDMSGDVFGNGMLLSRHLRLVAAFDHRHVFLDPDPDPERSFEERARLFALPRSSWADFDATVISAGGAVVPRDAKSVTLTAEVRAALGVPDATPVSVTPTELIALVLRAPVDLLWNGGIGTYVKARTESHADAGDKANDAVRVDGRDLRCRVVGEGGNLGVTQRGRVEYALAGGRINTDAIDNSAGVDCSDHEVNIKILLDRVVADGDLTTKQRDALLVEMTDEVAALVLTDNVEQNQALANARAEARPMLDVAARHIAALEMTAHLDRDLEALPGTEALAERRLGGSGLTSPELSVLMAYTKIRLTGELVLSNVVDDPYFDAELVAYFPTALRERYRDRMRAHRLHREIVGAALANHVVNRAGISMVHRMVEETASPGPDIVRAHVAASRIFDFDAHWDAVASLDLTGEVRARMLLEGRRLVERATRWLLRNRRAPLDVGGVVESFRAGVAAVDAVLLDALVGGDASAVQTDAAAWIADGVPPEQAIRTATMDARFAALDIVEVAARRGVDIDVATRVHFLVGDRMRLSWLLDRVNELPRDDRWQTLARSALRDDLYREHQALDADVLSMGGQELSAEDRVGAWEQANASAVERCRLVLTDISAGSSELAQLSVALREIRNLIHQAVIG
jgi:glutamate dehydrogenase